MEGLKQVRVKMAGELSKVLPPTASIVINALQAQCESAGRIHLKFTCPGLPPSLNRMYERSTPFCKPDTPGSFQDRQGRWRVQSQKLTPKAIEWKLLLVQAMGQLWHKWTPSGVTAAVLLFESPYWLTAQRVVREIDVDNRVKIVFDAIQQATGTKDELHWNFYVEKILSKRQRTTIFLFDLGDIVEYYY